MLSKQGERFDSAAHFPPKMGEIGSREMYLERQAGTGCSLPLSALHLVS